MPPFAGASPPRAPAPAVEEAILPIRDEPPAGLQRTPGPQTILYDLDKREELKTAGHALPRATSPLWRILDQLPRLDRCQRPKAVPAPPAAPMEKGPIDVKSVSRGPPEEDGKRPHGVDTLKGIDVPTSIWVEAVPRAEDQAEPPLITGVDIFIPYG